MKRKLYLFLLLIFSALLSSCEMQFGHKKTENPDEYGKWESYLDVADFLPESIDDYTVNKYSYTLEAWLDICFEIYLDITVSEEQFNILISDAKSSYNFIEEKTAYYDEDYHEIIFEDYYKIFEDRSHGRVGWADIEKIIYNEETLNIIYVCFHANDTGVYQIDQFEYFNRFEIIEDEYIESVSAN